MSLCLILSYCNFISSFHTLVIMLASLFIIFLSESPFSFPLFYPYTTRFVLFPFLCNHIYYHENIFDDFITKILSGYQQLWDKVYVQCYFLSNPALKGLQHHDVYCESAKRTAADRKMESDPFITPCSGFDSVLPPFYCFIVAGFISLRNGCLKR